MPLVLLFPPSLGPVTASARAEQLSDWFGTRLGTYVTVEVAETYAELRQRIEDGEVDLAWAPPSVCAQVGRRARAIFKAVRGGSSVYNSALVGRAGAYSSAQQLGGTRAAWVDELSTAGYLLPAAHLRRTGVDLETMASQVFLGSYGAVVRAVVNGQADFCGVYVPLPDDVLTRATLAGFVGNHGASRLSVIAYTDPVPTDGLLVVDRRDAGGNELDVQTVATLVQAPDPTSTLLSILDAERLEPAAADEYSVLA